MLIDGLMLEKKRFMTWLTRKLTLARHRLQRNTWVHNKLFVMAASHIG